MIETTIAMGLIAGALVGLAQLFAISIESNLGSRDSTYAAVLAEQKLEELLSLTYTFDATGAPLTDTTSDTTASPETATGGTGLSPSPTGALSSNTAGYIDHVDGFGRKLGGGAQSIGGARYTRRWSIEPLPANPANAIVIQVLVTHESGAAQSWRDVHLATIRTRKTR